MLQWRPTVQRRPKLSAPPAHLRRMLPLGMIQLAQTPAQRLLRRAALPQQRWELLPNYRPKPSGPKSGFGRCRFAPRIARDELGMWVTLIIVFGLAGPMVFGDIDFGDRANANIAIFIVAFGCWLDARSEQHPLPRLFALPAVNFVRISRWPHTYWRGAV